MADIGVQPRRTILIVDDSLLNRMMLSKILGDGYDYLYAEDGEKALAFLSKNTHVDILLLDMNMPKLGGMDVLKVMKERHWTEEIPVVIISAEDDVGFMQNAYRLGAIDYIVRPFNAFLVQHRVENTLAMYTQNKRLVKLVENQVLQREKTNNMLINIFSHVVEVRNHESGSHTLRVQAITGMLLNRLVRITDKYPLSETDIAMIASASALHDIGKITIPEEILNKPGKLTAEEWEIMKAHTVNGDNFLSDIPIEQSGRLMITAHEICRYHHERYDGSGYPDGLKGDEIPISAQAVAVADVYDALTSDRCYKKAFSHEVAVSMILNGECGAFNPLLLQSFMEISDELLVNRKLNSDAFDYENSVRTLTGEALESEELFLSDRNAYLADIEREKKKFFAGQCGGIQFEYDAVMGKVLYINYYNDRGEKIHLPVSATNLLTEADGSILREKVAETTREKPFFTMEVMVLVNEALQKYRMAVQTIWAVGADSYVSIVGQLTPVSKVGGVEGSMPPEGKTSVTDVGDKVGFAPGSTALPNYYQDSVTKAYTRSYLDNLQSAVEQPKGVAMVDINNFKRINNEYGHRTGDMVLKHISMIIGLSLREEDVLIRYGGDEFLVLFKEIGEDEFFRKLEGIQHCVEEAVMEDYPDLKAGISIGGAYGVTPLANAIDMADKAMYRNKFQMIN